MSAVFDYLAPAMGDMRHYLTEWPKYTASTSEEAGHDEHVRETLRLKSAGYTNELTSRYSYLLEEHSHGCEDLLGALDPETDDLTLPAPPDLVADELERVSELRDDLDAYLKFLVVFAHRYAIEDHSKSELSRLTGASRVTIAKWLSDPDLERKVASVARARAEQAYTRHAGPESTVDEAALTLLRWYSMKPEAATKGPPSADGDHAADQSN